MSIKIAEIELDRNGGAPNVDVIFNDHVCSYYCYLWDKQKKSAELKHGNNVDLVPDNFDITAFAVPGLDKLVFSYEAIIQAAEVKPGQVYSMTITVRQGGKICNGGVVSEVGNLDSVVPVIGFRRFKVV